MDTVTSGSKVWFDFYMIWLLYYHSKNALRDSQLWKQNLKAKSSYKVWLQSLLTKSGNKDLLQILMAKWSWLKDYLLSLTFKVLLFLCCPWSLGYLYLLKSHGLLCDIYLDILTYSLIPVDSIYCILLDYSWYRDMLLEWDKSWSFVIHFQ